MKILKILFINIAIFTGMIASIELSLNIAKFIRDKVKYSELVISNAIQTGKTIPTERHKVFHPGVGHSNKLNNFRKNINTSELSFDNLSATEVFQNDDDFSLQFKVLTLGGSTTDPLGTQYSGFRGTWVHHLFDSISTNSFSRYVVENAGSGGTTSSNELLRLITKFHSNEYDLVISFNGINEIYFMDPLLRNKENVLASKMLLKGINSGVIKGLEGKTFKIERTFPSNLIGYIKESTTFKQLSKFKTNLLSKKTLNANLTKKELGAHNISKEEKELLAYSAGIWEKNIKFMNSVSLAMNSKYLAILQPTLGLNKDYCEIINENCLVLDGKYLARIRYLYSILREKCSTKNYCLDISNDLALTIDDSLYTDVRHPNSEGNKRIADLIRDRVTQLLVM